MQKILETISQMIMGIGLFGMIVIADWIAGVNKSMRMGQQAYPKETKKKKWKWVGIFAIFTLIGFVLFWLVEA